MRTNSAWCFCSQSSHPSPEPLRARAGAPTLQQAEGWRNQGFDFFSKFSHATAALSPCLCTKRVGCAQSTLPERDRPVSFFISLTLLRSLLLGHVLAFSLSCLVTCLHFLFLVDLKMMMIAFIIDSSETSTWNHMKISRKEVSATCSKSQNLASCTCSVKICMTHECKNICVRNINLETHENEQKALFFFLE